MVYRHNLVTNNTIDIRKLW